MVGLNIVVEVCYKKVLSLYLIYKVWGVFGIWKNLGVQLKQILIIFFVVCLWLQNIKILRSYKNFEMCIEILRIFFLYYFLFYMVQIISLFKQGLMVKNEIDVQILDYLDFLNLLKRMLMNFIVFFFDCRF